MSLQQPILGELKLTPTHGQRYSDQTKTFLQHTLLLQDLSKAIWGGAERSKATLIRRNQKPDWKAR